MINSGHSFNYDGRRWIIVQIVSVSYVSHIGYVITVVAADADSELPRIDSDRAIDLIANGTPLGYSS